MSDVIIWTQDNGILAVTHPAENCGLTTEEIAEKDLPDGKPYKIMDSSKLPESSIFRDAWVADDNWTISIDMERAREVWRNKIRFARASKWEQLDVAYMKALEISGDVSEIVEEKIMLRDFPNQESIELSESVEELELICNTSLLGDK